MVDGTVEVVFRDARLEELCHRKTIERAHWPGSTYNPSV